MKIVPKKKNSTGIFLKKSGIWKTANCNYLSKRFFQQIKIVTKF